MLGQKAFYDHHYPQLYGKYATLVDAILYRDKLAEKVGGYLLKKKGYLVIIFVQKTALYVYNEHNQKMNIQKICFSFPKKVVSAFRDFGMPDETISECLFLEKNKVIRIGVPPVRLEVITSASGVSFNECYSNREVIEIDGISINFISLQDLKKNKHAAGRYKDLEHLP